VQKAQGDEPQQETTKKRKNISPSLITKFGNHQPYNKTNLVQHGFHEDLILYITNGYHPLSSIENPWLRRMVLKQCPRVLFPFQHQPMTNVLPNIVKKIKEKCFLPSFTSCVTCITSFNLWMSCGGHDTFVMVVSFINNLWKPTHVTMGIFEVHNTTITAMAN
jgi:hypothetical protein